ncbi:sulfatase-like hydrolase/transferase [Parafilimonas sp.]|uniref:sulfatase-like hydrolase/transferase n=1 Tax=Parafilimonas sp. TaxID=1969739 RepID=UPI0039E2F80D
MFCFFSPLTGCHKQEIKIPEIPGDTTSPVISSSRLNVILILADDVGYEVPSFCGGQSYQTPNIDFMAANGTQFTNCYGSALCSPSRFMLLTGKYNFRNYATWGVMDQSQRTFANIFKLAGYTTCASGKWQFDGGDNSIKLFGFDKYRVNNAYNLNSGGSEETANQFYKNPQIYENGSYLPDSETNGKYGQDMFRDYVFDFIDSNANKNPFFVYWALDLCHAAFSPTPDDAAFASWDPNAPRSLNDTLYFPEMVTYMDKLIGELVNKVKDVGIADSTIIIFTADNGTANIIHSSTNGIIVPGGKSLPLNLGTHMPFVAYCPGLVPAGRKDTSLISFADFMATFADIAKVSIPASYGTTDGVSFAPQLTGQQYILRDWVFNHYPGAGKYENDPKHLRRWMQNAVYKQYDTTANPKGGKFYNLAADPFEQNPLNNSELTTEEKALRKSWFKTMSTLH